MATLMEKHIQLADDQAQRLEHRAQTSGVSESALVEQALELLFGEQSEPLGAPDVDRARIDPSEAVFVVGTPVSSGSIRRQGDGR